ncbi:hypothetical protein [Microcoleus sp. Pol11C3]|uniref:hypothetical protein n=1 Tax=Microcoleus sp. Pol11C3 TaxID=3055390 RepID=UPI002FD15675
MIAQPSKKPGFYDNLRSLTIFSEETRFLRLHATKKNRVSAIADKLFMGFANLQFCNLLLVL